MSLPEPINWLHMSEAQYIYLVSTGPPERDVKTDRDFWQNFSEPSNKGMVPLTKKRFWNFNNWEFFTNEQKAIERAKEINREREKISEQQKLAIEQLEKFESNLNRKMSVNVHKVVLYIAEKQNLDFVIDSSHGYNIIEADCKDIFNDVKQELIKYIQTQ